MASIGPGSGARILADCALRPIRTRVPDPNAISALTSQTHLNRATTEFLEGYKVIERRAIASSLKFGLLAKGDADIYPRIGPTSEWDTARSRILAAADGTVMRLDGTPMPTAMPSRGSRNGLNRLGARTVAETSKRLGSGCEAGFSHTLVYFTQLITRR